MKHEVKFNLPPKPHSVAISQTPPGHGPLSPWYSVCLPHSCQTHYLAEAISCHLQAGRARWSVSLWDIVCRNAFGERGRAKWMNAASSLGISPQRRVANPIILHHSSAIHLASSVFLNGQFVASLLDLLEASVFRLQNPSRDAWDPERRPLNTVCNCATVHTGMCQPAACCQK